MTQRPELHITPESGILEAPAGALFDGYSWHVFTQYRPLGSSASRWSHTVSHGNPFSWEECDDILAPEGSETALRAGSVTAVGDDVTLYFTTVHGDAKEISVAHIENLDETCEDISDDPLQVDTHATRRGSIIGDTGEFKNFRSPCVVPDWDHDVQREGHVGWLMLAVTGSGDHPRLVILDSENGSRWALRGPLEIQGESGIETARIVAPRIIRLRDQVDQKIYDVLICTLEHNGVDVSGYLVGTLKDCVFEVATPFRRVDYGHDFVRPRNTNRPSSAIDPAERYDAAVIFGLLNGIGRLDDDSRHPSLDAEGWANALSLPRHVTLEGGLLYQTPVVGLPTAIEHSDNARMWVGLCEIPEGEKLTVELIDSLGQIACTVTHHGDHLELDRSMNPQHAGDTVALAPLNEGDTDAITIVADGSTVEVFVDGGQVAMASRVYFQGHCESFHCVPSEGARIERENVIAPSRLLSEEAEGFVR